MRIAIGADHRGADVMAQIVFCLERDGHEVQQVRVCSDKTCDYPDTAYPVALAVSTGDAERGILICGSGIGMCIAANKVRGIRGALVHDEIGAEQSRSHNDANVLCLPADLLGIRLIERIVQKWMTTEFAGGRHARRVSKIHAIEEGRSPAEVTDAADAIVE